MGEAEPLVEFAWDDFEGSLISQEKTVDVRKETNQPQAVGNDKAVNMFRIKGTQRYEGYTFHIRSVHTAKPAAGNALAFGEPTLIPGSELRTFFPKPVRRVPN